MYHGAGSHQPCVPHAPNLVNLESTEQDTGTGGVFPPPWTLVVSGFLSVMLVYIFRFPRFKSV
jgi:hypothetical protein